MNHQEILSRTAFSTVEELQQQLATIVDTHGKEHHPSTIYVNNSDTDAMIMSLYEITLSDGSKVLDMRIRPRREMPSD